MNTSTGLKPMYDEDFEEKKKLKLGEIYRAKIVRPRNILFHRKFFALIKVGWENTKEFEEDVPLNVYRRWCISKAGFYKLYHTKKGVLVEADSISFDSMDEDQFSKVYEGVLNVVIKDTGADREFIENNLLSFM